MSIEITRINDKIRILKEILERKEFVIIAQGDPDYPEGLKFKMPKEWEKDIIKVINELKKKLIEHVNKL